MKNQDFLYRLTKIQREWLKKRLDKSDFGERMRLHYYLGVVLEDENEIQECFHIIQAEMLEATIKSLSYNENARIVTDRHTVNLPLRVNWGGGWSDTPPYCNENGGTVLNVAILLNGKKPVEVTLERIDELKIVFDREDWQEIFFVMLSADTLEMNRTVYLHWKKFRRQLH